MFGHDMLKKGVELRRRIGYLPSEVAYYDRMTGEDLLLYSARFYGKPDKQRLNMLADWFELDTGKYIDDLSFGNKKKVGIVQALLHRPELLILDEPTSGLDPLMQSRFFQLLRQENNQGTTIFFSSHTLSEVQQFCEKVAVIRQGQVLEVSSVEELQKKHLKRVTLQCAQEVGWTALLTGIHGLKVTGQRVRFHYDGALNDLFAALSQIDVQDFKMEDPTLEEIFMHYYTDERQEVSHEG